MSISTDVSSFSTFLYARVARQAFLYRDLGVTDWEGEQRRGRPREGNVLLFLLSVYPLLHPLPQITTQESLLHRLKREYF